MTEPIVVHKCKTTFGFYYFKKESVLGCSVCRNNPYHANAREYARENKHNDMWLQEDLVDEMNKTIFDKHRLETEIENDAIEFFNPSKTMEVIDNTLKKPRKLY